jgi:hypothetical protein
MKRGICAVAAAGIITMYNALDEVKSRLAFKAFHFFQALRLKTLFLEAQNCVAPHGLWHKQCPGELVPSRTEVGGSITRG